MSSGNARFEHMMWSTEQHQSTVSSHVRSDCSWSRVYYDICMPTLLSTSHTICHSIGDLSTPPQLCCHVCATGSKHTLFSVCTHAHICQVPHQAHTRQLQSENRANSNRHEHSDRNLRRINAAALDQPQCNGRHCWQSEALCAICTSSTHICAQAAMHQRHQNRQSSSSPLPTDLKRCETCAHPDAAGL